MKHTYNSLFRAATEEHLPEGYDWRLLKAQGFKESSLEPKAVSPAGAKGLMQFMPGTWEEWAPGQDIFDPAASIDAGARYMAWLWGEWSWEREWVDRASLVLASYNAGLGNVLEAQRLAQNTVLYGPVARKLDLVTGRHAGETIDYVRKTLWFWLQEVCNPSE